MPLLSPKEVLNLKLNCIKLQQLKKFASSVEIPNKGSSADIIKRVLEEQLDEGIVDEFIRQEYAEGIEERKSVISDEDLRKELLKVHAFSWGAVQGQLDRKIQTEYVRRFVRYEDLLINVRAKLHEDVTNYVICSWFNHWTTVLIEEHISSHPKVIPTIKNIKGIDIFFDGQPFDLKVTYLPRDYDPIDAVRDPSALAVWMYENQSALRFGADNRLFVVLSDKDNPQRSWELKRDFALVFEKIDDFFDRETVSEKDEIVFSFHGKTYTAVTKVLIIIK